MGSLALDPQNPNAIYVGTGEENNSGDSYYGAGILKSTDGGNTWTQIPGPFAGGSGGGARIGGLAVHPTNSQVVLAATGCCAPGPSGVYRSADGGNTWTNVLNVSGSQAYNVYFDSTNGSNAFASLDDHGVYRSTDGGQTWIAANGAGASSLPTSGTGRVALAMDPNSPATLYAGVTAAAGTLYGLYKTTNSGGAWTQLTNTPNYCGGQCWYDNVIGIPPGRPNVIFAGGGCCSPLVRSLDGGNTWTQITAVHPDSHALAFASDGSKLYTGNDGGVWSTTDIANSTMNWTDLNAGLSTLQFYSGSSLHPTDINQGFGGTQDNSTEQYSGALPWTSVDCGDGGQSAIDFVNPNNVYLNCIGITLDKSTDGGHTFASALNGINTSDRGNWVSALTMDPNNSSILYFGTQYLYQTTNGAGVWSAISPDLTAGTGSLAAIAVAPADSNTIYTASNDGKVFVTRNALSGASSSWTDATHNLPGKSITAIAADPHTPATAYLTLSGFSGYGDQLGHVFKTTNAGVAWSDISGDLPNIPANDIVVDSGVASTIYVATDIGVFYTTNGGVSWATLVSGLPRVAVFGLKLHTQSRTLRAATHGRSMWDLNVTTVVGVPAITSLAPSSTLAGSAAFALTVNGTGFTSSSMVQWNGVDLTTTFIDSGQLSAAVPASDIALAGLANVSVLNPGGAGSVSNVVTFAINNPVPGTPALSPSSAAAGSAGFTLTANGSNFVSNSVMQWNGSARSTTFVNSTKLSAAIAASDVASAGTASVTVMSPGPGGGTSSAATFTINNPLPSVSSLSPSSVTAGASAFTLTVNGSNFVATSTVQWNGSARTTTYVNSGEITAAISAADVAVFGTVSVTVMNPAPGGGTSAGMTFTIANPVPAATSLSPTNTAVGGNSFTLTVRGSNFVNSSVVRWNGSNRGTTFVNSRQITASISAADIANAGTSSVTVLNPAPGGGETALLTFTVKSPAITTLSPSSATAGGPAFTLTVNGSNFLPSSVVHWNGASRTTVYVNGGQLHASITAADIALSGSNMVTVVNPTAASGGTSGSRTFTVNNPVPTLTSLSPSSGLAGTGAFTLTLNGTKFVTNSSVKWNGATRATTYVSSTKLTAAILASDMAAASTAHVTVTNPGPGGGTSATLNFTITNPVPAITQLQPSSTKAGGAAFTLSLTGTGFLSNSVVLWNGSPRTTTYQSGTHIQAAISASDIATAGTAQVTVSNPAPGGGVSGPATFTIKP